MSYFQIKLKLREVQEFVFTQLIKYLNWSQKLDLIRKFMLFFFFKVMLPAPFCSLSFQMLLHSHCLPYKIQIYWLFFMKPFSIWFQLLFPNIIFIIFHHPFPTCDVLSILQFLKSILHHLYAYLATDHFCFLLIFYPVNFK